MIFAGADMGSAPAFYIRAYYKEKPPKQMLRWLFRLKDALAFQYADADYCDKSDNAYDDERINVFQRDF